MLRDGDKLAIVCDGCAKVIFSVDMVHLPKGFPFPITAIRPMIKMAIDAVRPDFEGCILLCKECKADHPFILLKG